MSTFATWAREVSFWRATIFAITLRTFAVLGLRPLYFTLASMIRRFI